MEIIYAEFYNRVLIDNQEQTAINHSEVFRAEEMSFGPDGDVVRVLYRDATRSQSARRHAHQSPGTATSEAYRIWELRGNKKTEEHLEEQISTN